MNQEVRRKDFHRRPFYLTHTDLTLDLDKENTKVTNIMTFKRRHGKTGPLVLDGDNIDLTSIAVDNVPLQSTEFSVKDGQLTIHKELPRTFTVSIQNTINPEKNTALEGVYRSDDIYVSQCEAQGFRRVTWFYDGPDNLARYKTTLIADQKENPLLISNGNCIKKGKLENGKHFATYDDPNPKPSYLWAMVAGNLRTVQDYYNCTLQNKTVDLKIHVPADKADQVSHAMYVLQQAMRWDEDKYKLPYDLDNYNIVGVEKFNAGAMENKGLNIFNANSLLASPKLATDTDYSWIWTVVGHEFFHNYAGNRVTVKKWHELSLKEGLATQKEREFKADMLGYTVPRIKDVSTLRSVQFPEDASPMSHPVRLDAYQEIDNCYTTTTYYKGAELLSMLSGLLGQEAWRTGVKHYFDKYDGKAATISEFLHALSESSGRNLHQFKRWYTQPGTPELSFTENYDPITSTYTLTVEQQCASKDPQAAKKPFHIPIKMGLLDLQGKPIALKIDGKNAGNEIILELTQKKQTFTFENMPHRPIPSLMRDFSAPVKVIKSVHNENDLAFLMAHDPNEFNRWDAAQSLSKQVIFDAMDAIKNHKPVKVSDSYLKACEAVFSSTMPDDLKAAILSMPSQTQLLAEMQSFDPDLLAKAMDAVLICVTGSHHKLYEAHYQNEHHSIPAEYSPKNASRRALSNFCLNRMVAFESKNKKSEWIDKAYQQFYTAQNLTNKMAAMEAFAGLDQDNISKQAKEHFKQMNEQFKNEAKGNIALYNNWLGIQGLYQGGDIIKHLQTVMNGEEFDITNPNMVRELLRGFMRNNHQQFHKMDGSGYHFIADQIIALESINPKMGSALATILVKIPNLDNVRLYHLRRALEKINKLQGLSTGVKEAVDKGLAALPAVSLESLCESIPQPEKEESFLHRASSLLSQFTHMSDKDGESDSVDSPMQKQSSKMVLTS